MRWTYGLLLGVLLVAGCPSDGGSGASSAPSPASAGPLEVTFLRLADGQRGSPIILRTPRGNTYVIDTGASISGSNAGARIGSYLESKGVTSIQGLVITHPHGDHYEGAAWLLNNWRVETLYDSGYTGGSYSSYGSTVLAARDPAQTARVSPVWAGMTFDWDPELHVEVLGPRPGYFPTSEINLIHTGSPSTAVASYVPANENSIILRIQHGQAVLLFCGDADRTAVTYLHRQHPARIRAHILGAPHHGEFFPKFDPRDTPAGDDINFRNDTSPKAVILSFDRTDSGTDNEFDYYRRDNAWNVVRDAFRTRDVGHVVIRSTGSALTLTTHPVPGTTSAGSAVQTAAYDLP